MKISKGDIIFSFSLLLAIWFAWTGMVWVYNAALVIAYPAALISLLLWRTVRKTDERMNRYKVIPIILIIGLVLSLIMLISLLIFE